MSGEHGLVLAYLEERIAQTKQSAAHLQIRIQGAVNGEEHSRAAALLRSRTTELALWSDILAFAQNNIVPSVQGQEAARSAVEGSHTGRPAWMDGHTRPVSGSSGERTWGALRADQEQARQHGPTPPGMRSLSTHGGDGLTACGGSCCEGFKAGQRMDTTY